MVAILLARTCTDIPFPASFDLETLDSIFQLGNSSQMVQQAKICPDAAYVLLAMIRVLIHQVCELLCVNSLHVLSMVPLQWTKRTSYIVALFPGPHRFRLHKECGGPGIFSHECDVKGRKVVERT